MSESAYRPLRAIGLMSGTSLDGVDAALVVTDGRADARGVLTCGPALTLAYDDSLRNRLRAVLSGAAPVLPMEQELTLWHARAVEHLLARAGLDRTAIDVIGFHGQTVLHRPDLRLTWQIGDGATLARRTGITVVNDFRTADIDHGGQGAPLVPIYHTALARTLPEGPLVVLNVGGVGNVTWIDRPDADGGQDSEGAPLLAFDTGPGNALIDDWVFRHTGAPCDRDGEKAQAGRIDAATLAALERDPYFDRPPPKSLDRNDFSLERAGIESLSVADGAATLTAFTACAVARAVPHFPKRPVRWLVCGGGRRNPALMAALRQHLAAPVDAVERVGWDGDALEAQAFAFLAVRSLYGLPLTFPGTTGAPRALTGGVRHPCGQEGPFTSGQTNMMC
ncbi:MAG: anhydro-N-acetylmuramic acid kinase [Rhodospirillaceae bacterium]|nr:MAG: anhydro-N-acetylmuramic acid kinase [Rhodospirillaceae bacterium]